jgi:copper(I)-binding protein
LNIKTPKKKGKKFKIDINFSTIYDINSTAIVVQTININKHKICIYM